ncbi:MAG: uroporphyrinogen-III synthase, partial [Myxococcota bacterium]
GTVVLFMAWRTVDECCAQLIAAGRAPDTPAAAIYWGTTAAQRTAVATLRDLSEVVATAQLRPPVLLVIGEVVALRPSLAWYETRPLFGARALVTRNPEQAQTFVRAVAELGGETVVAPVTRIAPPPAESAAELDRVIAELDRYHWVLFTSANSVVRFFAELRQRARDSRALGRARIACVGPATARAIERFGITADVVPAHGDAEGLARAVLAAGAEPGAVLLPRAASGRDEAIHVLGAAGFAVDAVAVYQTEPSPAEQPAVAAGLARLRAGTIDIIALFAPSQVRALAQLLGPDAAALIRACRVVAAIGKTTAAALQRIGVAVDVIPSRPDADILVSEIAALCEHRPRSSSSPAAGPASSSPGRGSPVSPAPRRGHSEES